MKQAIVIRADLKLSAGKAAAQAAHAALQAYNAAKLLARKKWEREGAKKVVLAVDSERELRQIFKSARKTKLPAVLITDAGLTEIPPGTPTAVGIGPAEEIKIDKITGNLKLY